MKENIYQQLRKHLDHMPVPFPATASGVELDLLKSLFTEEEATIACELSAFPESAERIYPRLKKKYQLEDLKQKLDKMVKKGIIVRRLSKDSKTFLYQKIPLAIGMFEFQVNQLDKNFARLFFDYEKEAFFDGLFTMKNQQMRTIPINVAIEPQFSVGNYDDIRKVIKDSPGPFALMNCVCRQAKDLLEDSCKVTNHRESCITLEESAKYMIDRGVAREISRDELMKFLTLAKKEGLILQPENTQHPTFICCCCSCCCGILSAAAKYDQPAEYIHSNFRMEVNITKCDGCEDCIERCQMHAILKTEGHVEILNERCIGCGVCIPVCKQKALRLVKKEKETVPPLSKNEMYKKMMIERYGVPRALGYVIKSRLGMKV
jgi:NAD-dependent dihydropyrimidine dehydrogenase PreA subunit